MAASYRHARGRRRAFAVAPWSVAAVILEPVTGANGVLAPSPGYLRSIREVCEPKASC